MRPAGWCYKHYTLVYPSKLRNYCKTRNKGKVCKYFTYQIPEWKAGKSKELTNRANKGKWRKKK